MLDCIFCKIINGELPSTKIFEDDEVLVFKDINPLAPIHHLIVPKVHFSSIIEAKNEHKELLGKLLLTARDVAEKLELSDKGYRIVVNNGKDAGQIVFHLHLHLLAGWKDRKHTL